MAHCFTQLNFLILHIGFFSGDSQTQPLREPTQEEVDALVERTALFYTEIFRNQYGDDFSMFEVLGKFCTHASAIIATPTSSDPSLIISNAMVASSERVEF